MINFATTIDASTITQASGPWVCQLIFEDKKKKKR